MEYGTKAYTQETPTWLWEIWTGEGPGTQADRYCDRITQLIAVDVLVHCPERLDDRQQREAESLAAEVDLDV